MTVDCTPQIYYGNPTLIHLVVPPTFRTFRSSDYQNAATCVDFSSLSALISMPSKISLADVIIMYVENAKYKMLGNKLAWTLWSLFHRIPYFIPTHVTRNGFQSLWPVYLKFPKGSRRTLQVSSTICTSNAKATYNTSHSSPT